MAAMVSSMFFGRDSGDFPESWSTRRNNVKTNFLLDVGARPTPLIKDTCNSDLKMHTQRFDDRDVLSPKSEGLASFALFSSNSAWTATEPPPAPCTRTASSSSCDRRVGGTCVGPPDDDTVLPATSMGLGLGSFVGASAATKSSQIFDNKKSPIGTPTKASPCSSCVDDVFSLYSNPPVGVSGSWISGWGQNSDGRGASPENILLPPAQSAHFESVPPLGQCASTLPAAAPAFYPSSLSLATVSAGTAFTPRGPSCSWPLAPLMDSESDEGIAVEDEVDGDGLVESLASSRLEDEGLAVDGRGAGPGAPLGKPSRAMLLFQGAPFGQAQLLSSVSSFGPVRQFLPVQQIGEGTYLLVYYDLRNAQSAITGLQGAVCCGTRIQVSAVDEAAWAAVAGPGGTCFKPGAVAVQVGSIAVSNQEVRHLLSRCGEVYDVQGCGAWRAAEYFDSRHAAAAVSVLHATAMLGGAPVRVEPLLYPVAAAAIGPSAAALQWAARRAAAGFSPVSPAVCRGLVVERGFDSTEGWPLGGPMQLASNKCSLSASMSLAAPSWLQPSVESCLATWPLGSAARVGSGAADWVGRGFLNGSAGPVSLSAMPGGRTRRMLGMNDDSDLGIDSGGGFEGPAPGGHLVGDCQKAMEAAVVAQGKLREGGRRGRGARKESDASLAALSAASAAAAAAAVATKSLGRKVSSVAVGTVCACPGERKESRLHLTLDPDRVEAGLDRRTTLMIRNIPNKYSQKMLLSAVDESHRGAYDFFYLPIDFKNKCNVGYAFINFIDPLSISSFAKTFDRHKWERFNSDKVCELTYARIQGKAALISHFQNSSLMAEDRKCRPLIFHSDGPLVGTPEPFPVGPNIRRRDS